MFTLHTNPFNSIDENACRSALQTPFKVIKPLHDSIVDYPKCQTSYILSEIQSKSQEGQKLKIRKQLKRFLKTEERLSNEPRINYTGFARMLVSDRKQDKKTIRNLTITKPYTANNQYLRDRAKRKEKILFHPSVSSK